MTAIKTIGIQNMSSFSIFANGVVKVWNTLAHVMTLATLEFKISRCKTAIELLYELRSSHRHHCDVLQEYTHLKKKLPHIFCEV